MATLRLEIRELEELNGFEGEEKTKILAQPNMVGLFDLRKGITHHAVFVWDQTAGSDPPVAFKKSGKCYPDKNTCVDLLEL